MYETIPKNNAGFISQETIRPDTLTYDYVTVDTSEKMVLETIDCYEALGWQLVKREGTLGLKTAVTFKRNRKIANKNELIKIQAKLDEALNMVNKFESKKTTKAFATAMGVGIPGILTFGGGMCLCLLNSAIGAIVGGVALGAAGLAICDIGYLAYRKINKKKINEMNVLIDKKREEISSICEDANKCRS